ncbi:MAG: alpha-galactosidase [Lysinibacillus sp.]
MYIQVTNNGTQFHLSNGKLSYLFHVMKNGHLGHLYYGKSIRGREDFSRLQAYQVPTGNSTHLEDDSAFSIESFRQEFPCYGKGDFRDPALSLRKPDGSHTVNFVYKKYEIISGKPTIPGMPATYAGDEEASTLQVILEEKHLRLELILNYTIFHKLPVITRSASLKNYGSDRIYIEKLMSASVDFPDKDFNLVHLAGAWTRECQIKTRKLESGIQSIASTRGASSHHHNPFLALKRPHVTEHTGEVFGFNFVYSSNFLAQAEVDHYENTRVLLGINPFRFEWRLEPKELFHSPEAVMVYSKHGMNGMSQTFHDLYRNHLIPKRWRKEIRPILINNWEATYFDFNEEKLLSIADKAKNLGIELFVLDDGWFGNRNNDTSSLGDWTVDKEKLPGGLKRLADEVRMLGLKFGLWFEPEMVSPKSHLFEAHPDWAIGTPGDQPTLSRNQRVLDFSRDEVVEYIYSQMAQVIRDTELSYIKWDMNRYITEAYSAGLAADCQDEFFHRYILGVYKLYDRLTSEFPSILFESCAGGGGRVDPGLLYYAPQAWISDNTDAVERLKIQYGTSLTYPIYSMGSHVSAVPNHQTLRDTSLSMRADVAYFGTFGYELDPNRLTDEEQKEIISQVELYKQHRLLIRDGDFYRLKSPFETNETAWMIVSKDKSEALVGFYQIRAIPNWKRMQNLRLAGLKKDYEYMIQGQAFYGDELMAIGLPLPEEFNGVNRLTAKRGGDYQSQLFYVQQKREMGG